ncbi:MAG: FtsQ-type POTRA domain-containing protein [Deltaproteobacteria bacterium]|nr:FtsQ-type POTRA domain-containing protein [Deltaproteobacteria bacterium]
MKDFSEKKKRKAAKKERKKKARTFNIKTFLKKCGSVALTLAVIIALSAGLHYSWLFLSTADYFAISEVFIEGNDKINRNTLLRAAGLNKKRNIFTFDLANAGKKLEALPWMKAVKLERQFPHSLKIIVLERAPVAMINLEGFYYVDNEGYIFAEADYKSGWDYPVMRGIKKERLLEGDKKSFESISRGLEFLSLLKERRGTVSLKNLSELVLEEDGGLTVYAVGVGIPLHLGGEGFESRLVRAEKVLADLGRKGIKAKEIAADFDDRVFVKVAI